MTNTQVELKQYLQSVFLELGSSPSFDLFSFLNDLEIKFENYGYRKEQAKLDKDFTGNLLIIRTDLIGDFILTTPLIRETRNNFPKANIVLICSPAAYELAKTCPYVNEIYVYNGTFVNASISFTLINMLQFCYNNLWFNEDGSIKQYKIALSPQYGSMSFDPVLLSYLSGSEMRVGYGSNPGFNYTQHEDNPEESKFMWQSNSFIDKYLLTDDVNIPINTVHEVDKHLYLLQYLHLPINSRNLELWINETDKTVANSLPKLKRLIAVGLGAGSPHRIYNIKKYEYILNQIKDDNTEIVLLGGFKEKDYKINVPCINLINKLNLRETAAVIQRCNMFIGHDSSLMHMAATYNKPIILIHREARNFIQQYKALLSGVARFRPYYGDKEDKAIILQPEKPAEECSKAPIIYGICKGECNNKCINSIDPQLVIDAYKTLLNKFII